MLVPLFRRRFLRASALGAASLASGGAAHALAFARAHALPDTPRGPRASTVAVVGVAEFPSLLEAVRAAVAAAGGLGFVRPDDRVLLKPAVNSGNPYPATTDPETVLAVAQLVREAGGRPFVADRTMFLRSTEAAFRKTGIRDACDQARIECVPLDDAEVVALSHPLAASWPDRTIHLYRPALEADHIVNLCTPRTHRLGDFTMALKNNVGLVAGGRRARMHAGSGFKDRLAELSLLLRPALIVMDGRLGFGDGGPDSGALIRPGFVAASVDPVAIDAVGIAQLRIAGTNETLSRGSIWSIPLLRRAAAIGAGVSGPEAIRLAGMDADAEAAVRSRLLAS